MSKEAGTSSSPVVGEARPRARMARQDLAKRLGIILAVLSLLGTFATAVAALSSKADDDEVSAAEQRVEAKVAAVAARATALEAGAAETRADMRWLKDDNAWIKSALWALTQKAGLAVPPPPAPKGEP